MIVVVHDPTALAIHPRAMRGGPRSKARYTCDKRQRDLESRRTRPSACCARDRRLEAPVAASRWPAAEATTSGTSTLQFDTAQPRAGRIMRDMGLSQQRSTACPAKRSVIP
jgi:hypothetical protein